MVRGGSRTRSSVDASLARRHRLQQIVGRIDGERIERVAIEGGGEDDERPRLRQRCGERRAAHFRHLDVEKQQVRPVSRISSRASIGVAGFADHRHVTGFVQQLAHAHARRRLVVHDDGADHAATRTSGMAMRAMVTPAASSRVNSRRRPVAEVSRQPLAHAAQAEALAVTRQHVCSARPRPGVAHLDGHLIGKRPHDHVDATRSAGLRDAVLDRVLDQCLQQHRRHLRHRR